MTRSPNHPGLATVTTMCARLDAILAKTSLRPTALDAICKKLDNLAGASTVRQLCSIQPGAPVALVYGKEPKCRN